MEITPSKIEMMRREASADPDKILGSGVTDAATAPEAGCGGQRGQALAATVSASVLSTFRVLVSQERRRSLLLRNGPAAGSPARSRLGPGARACAPGRCAPQPVPGPAPAQDHAAGTAPPPPEADAAPEHVLLPPHPLRLAAFLIDLALVAAVAAAATALTWSLAEFIVVLVVVWVIYQTGMVWLTGGRTVGKSACGLSVRHIDGSASGPGPGLASGGRSAAPALATCSRTCSVWASWSRYAIPDGAACTTTCSPARSSWLPPTPPSLARGSWTGLTSSTRTSTPGLEANAKRFAPLWKLWKWLLVVASPTVGAWQVLTRIFAPVWRPIKKRLSGACSPQCHGLKGETAGRTSSAFDHAG